MSRYNLLNHPVKNVVLAIAMMLFLALSFKLAGDLSTDDKNTVLSPTDSVVSTLNQPVQSTVPIAVPAE